MYALLLAMIVLVSCEGSSRNRSQDADVAVSPTSAAAIVLERGGGKVRAVALMFEVDDDGRGTEDILRTLREQQVRATFVVTGVWAEEHRELLFSISAEGHRIINGTYDGQSWTGASTGEPPLTGEERALALSRAEVTVYRYTSRSTRPYFRPPYDDVDDSVLRDAAANGYGIVVMWTLSLAESSPAEIVEHSEAGAIVSVPTADAHAGALSEIIDGLRAQEFGLVTVGEMAP